MFGISWLTPELFVQGLAIFIGIVVGAFFNFLLQRRQWKKEQKGKDMTIIYEPLFEEINKLLERKELLRKSPTSPYLPYIAPYKKIDRSGKVNPETHDELRKDMKDLIGGINDENKAFNILLNKLKPLCKKTLESIPVILTDGQIRSLNEYHIIDEYEIMYENGEEWGTNFDNKIKEIEERTEIDKVELKVTGKAIFDQLFSDIKREREDFFSKEGKIFDKAEDIKKKLDYKTTYPMKRYGEHIKGESYLQFFKPRYLIYGVTVIIIFSLFAWLIDYYFVEYFSIKALILAPILEEGLKFFLPFCLISCSLIICEKVRKKKIEETPNTNKILLFIFLGSFFLCAFLIAQSEIAGQNLSFYNGDAFRKCLSHLMYTIPFITMFFFYHEKFYYGWAISAIYHSIYNMIHVFKGNLFFPIEPFATYLQWVWVICISFLNIILIFILFKRNRGISE